MHEDGAGHPLDTAPAGWRDRQAVLAYGSNANPSKISWMRAELGLAGPVVVAHAHCDGLAAVWASGLRYRDGQRPATLTALPGVEEHALWFVTPDQLAVLDVCEARGNRYHLVRLTEPRITLEDGSPVTDVLAYIGAVPIRYPLLVDGKPVRTADVPQAQAVDLHGEPAGGPGVACEVVEPPDGRTFP